VKFAVNHSQKLINREKQKQELWRGWRDAPSRRFALTEVSLNNRGRRDKPAMTAHLMCDPNRPETALNARNWMYPISRGNLKSISKLINHISFPAASP
jgi:hypothetical protein